MNFEVFKEELEKININLNEDQINQFKKYLVLLKEEAEKVNLTAIKDDPGIIEKHFYDSLLLAKNLLLSNQVLLDLGSGAGFPGIPLKIAFPSLKITLLEPTIKKARFLAKVINELNLHDIVVMAERAETFADREREQYDIVVARAVSQLNILLELALPLVHVDGYFVAYKGARAGEEIQEGQNAMHILGGKIHEIILEKLPTESDRRAILIIKKVASTPSEYPRQYGAIKKRPL